MNHQRQAPRWASMQTAKADLRRRVVLGRSRNSSRATLKILSTFSILPRSARCLLYTSDAADDM
eukprot:2594437-Rhodomonas_salina.1